MTSVLSPTDETELATIVADAAAGQSPLAVVGGGTRTGLGRPVQAAATLTTARLTGVTLYEPSEMVLSARAGTPLAEIESLLAANGQRLAFEPPDYRPVYGTAGEPTVGAVAAANLSGPRRIQAGAARDGLIGLRAVTGRGEAITSGGRVMKNVTGYDLVKFLAGSYGTLAVLTEVTFKVLPSPETEATLVLSSLDDSTAIAALAAALGSPYSVTGAAHLPVAGSETTRTLVRIEGFAASVAYRSERLRGELALFGKADRLDEKTSAVLWARIRDLDAFAGSSATPLWRVSAKASEAPKIADAARAAFDCRILYDWGGALLWIAGGAGREVGAPVVRDAARAAGGHAVLFRAPDGLRNVIDVFEPPAPALMELSRKLKASFDPSGVLNPGRMYPGI